MRRCWRPWPTCAVVTPPCSTGWTMRSGRKSSGRCPDGKPPGGRRAATSGSSSRSTELVRLAAAGAGAVLVVDDAHDADDASLRLIHYLARSTITDRVLIVIAHRPKLCPALAQVRQSLLGRGSAVTLDLTAAAATRTWRRWCAGMRRGRPPT